MRVDMRARQEDQDTMSAIPVDEGFFVTTLQRLIGIHTSNPPGREEPATRYVGELLEGLGFELQYFAPEPLRTSALARLRGRGNGRSLLLGGHVDTQPLGDGWTKDPLGGQIEGGRIYGRGVADMKGGIAAMLTAAKAVVDAGVSRQGDLIFLIAADESSGGHKGTGYVVRQARVRADMGVMCEPGRGPIVRAAHRGAVWAEVQVIGKPGQGGRPETGINAIQVMAKVVTKLYEEVLPRWQSTKRHPLLPPPSLNVATIAAGLKPNVVPGTCTMQLDRRLLPGEVPAGILEEIQQAATEAVGGTGATVSVREILHVGPGEVPADSPAVTECQRAFQQVTRRSAVVAGTGGFTDAHWIIDFWGIPTVSFGPWYLVSEDRAVTDIPDESIDLQDAVTGSQVYARLIANVVA
jgi:acetylornithine deacetylase/succinyl-diaminopimelate desuccinylase family protein